MNCGRDTDDVHICTVIDLSIVIHLTDYKSQIGELQTSKMLADGLFLNIVIHWSDFFLVLEHFELAIMLYRGLQFNFRGHRSD